MISDVSKRSSRADFNVAFEPTPQTRAIAITKPQATEAKIQIGGAMQANAIDAGTNAYQIETVRAISRRKKSGIEIVRV